MSADTCLQTRVCAPNRRTAVLRACTASLWRAPRGWWLWCGEMIAAGSTLGARTGWVHGCTRPQYGGCWLEVWRVRGSDAGGLQHHGLGPMNCWARWAGKPARRGGWSKHKFITQDPQECVRSYWYTCTRFPESEARPSICAVYILNL